MAFASWNKSVDVNSPITHEEERANPSKSVAKTFGYMSIGIAITAVVAMLLGLLFGNLIGKAEINGGINTPAVAYLWILIVSFILLFIDSFVISGFAATGRVSIWIPYIIYAALMGVFISAFLVLGIDFRTMGMAFGIAALSYGGMFLIGYFSKINLNPLGLVALGFLFMLILFGGMLGLTFAITGTLAIFDIVFSSIVLLLFLIVAAVDAYNIRKIITYGDGNKNVCLYCAYVMYSDFIMIFIRVLILLLAVSRRN